MIQLRGWLSIDADLLDWFHAWQRINIAVLREVQTSCNNQDLYHLLCHTCNPPVGLYHDFRASLQGLS